MSGLSKHEWMVVLFVNRAGMWLFFCHSLRREEFKGPIKACKWCILFVESACVASWRPSECALMTHETFLHVLLAVMLLSYLSCVSKQQSNILIFSSVNKSEWRAMMHTHLYGDGSRYVTTIKTSEVNTMRSSGLWHYYYTLLLGKKKHSQCALTKCTN